MYTTIDGRLQNAANHAVRIGLIDYTRRHGWRGATNKVELDRHREPGRTRERCSTSTAASASCSRRIVISVAEKQAQVFIKGQGIATIEWAGHVLGEAPFQRTRARARAEDRRGNPRARRRGLRGARERRTARQNSRSFRRPRAPSWRSIPTTAPSCRWSAASTTSEGQGKFNRVTQAQRQPGSGFKPFMYAAAMAGNFTPASVILDAPIIMDDPNLEEVWRPENSGGGFRGPTRLREALVQSRNLVSIRLLQGDGRAAGDRLRAAFRLHAGSSCLTT